MPKYYYGALAPRVRAFAAANGVEYRSDDCYDIILRNIRTLKTYALADPLPNQTHVAQSRDKSNPR